MAAGDILGKSPSAQNFKKILLTSNRFQAMVWLHKRYIFALENNKFR